MRRKSIKQKVTRLFSDPSHPKFFLVSDFFALLTILSVLVIVLDTVSSLQKYDYIFFIIEWVSVTLFSIEYVVRLWISNPTRKYVFSFFGMIDLISIVPSFLGVGNLTFLKSARALRIIRLLRLIRTSSMKAHEKDEEYNPIAFNVLIYFAALLFALLVFGTAMFVFESGESFVSIPAGMWWSFKVFLASIPVDQPATAIGDALYVLTRFTGLMLLGLLIGVVGNVFRILIGSK